MTLSVSCSTPAQLPLVYTDDRPRSLNSFAGVRRGEDGRPSFRAPVRV